MGTEIIIARHGNTFKKGDVVTRVGARTDLPLVEEKKGRYIGAYLSKKGIIPDLVLSGPLKRHIQTAQYAIDEMSLSMEPKIIDFMNEVDYGMDENKPEEEVIARIGQDALDLWNTERIVPEGWNINVEELEDSWRKLSDYIMENFRDKRVLIVTSNGLIRFAPVLLTDVKLPEEFGDLKVGTGNLCLFDRDEDNESWICSGWNIKPKDYVDGNK